MYDGRCGDGQGAPILHQALAGTSRRLACKYALEIFSGAGHFAQACASAGLDCVAWDILDGAGADVLAPHAAERLCHQIASGDVAVVLLGTDCKSWSRARRADGRGPGPLRDDGDGLYGLPSLAARDQAKVELGNRLLQFTAKVVRCCCSHHVPVLIENPQTSRIWLTREMKQLSASGMHLSTCSFCQYGTSWRNNTHFLSNIPILNQVLKQCHQVHGRCSATNKPHLQLVGRNSAGVFLTLLAQPYPHELCKVLIRAALDFHHGQKHHDGGGF